MEKIFRNAPIMAKNDEVRRGLWDLARAHRMLDLEGQNDFAWGHACMRDPWDRGVWLKRANLGLEEVFEDDFILLDFDGNVLGGDGVRHLEWPIHTETLRARPDFNFVLHTHAPWSVLFRHARAKSCGLIPMKAAGLPCHRPTTWARAISSIPPSLVALALKSWGNPKAYSSAIMVSSWAVGRSKTCCSPPSF